MAKKLLTGLSLLVLVLGVACGDDEVVPPGGSGGGGSGGTGGDGGDGGDLCGGVACEDPKVCEGDECLCPCEFQQGSLCQTGFRCDTRTCACVERTGEIGDACTTEADCNQVGGGVAPICLTSDENLTFPGGYCTRSCDLDDNICPVGQLCSGFGCLAGCSTDSDCRTGYECVAISAQTDECGNREEGGDVARVCFPANSASACTGPNCGQVGAPCETNADCLEGGQCITGFEGGYCTIFDCLETGCGPGFAGEGAACFNIGNDADPQSECLAGATNTVCFERCDTTRVPDTCREGYTCAPGTNIGTECERDADCTFPGTTCVNGMCSKRCDPANRGNDCPAEGEWQCVATSGIGTQCVPVCNRDADCDEARGQSCSFQSPNPDWGQPTFTCSDASDCDVPGAICSKPTLPQGCGPGVPCPFGFDCTEDFLCVAEQGLCTPGCDEDADCPLTDVPGDTRTGICSNGQCSYGLCLGPSKLGSCQPGCTTAGDCAGCDSDTDCGQGSRCLDGVCLTPACENNINEARQACGIENNCGPGEEVVDGLCRLPCVTDGDCNLGATCDGGYCGFPARVCNRADGGCSFVCQSDAQCGPDHTCDPSGECIKTCESGNDCPQGACNRETGQCDSPCSQDSDCGENGLCVEKVCFRRCDVEEGRECPRNRFCEDGTGRCELRCDQPGGEACGPTEVCDPRGGQCQPRCPATPCPNGQVCQVDTGLCFQCLENDDCDNGLLCSPQNTCVQCLTNADCTAPQVCLPDNTCGAAGG